MSVHTPTLTNIGPPASLASVQLLGANSSRTGAIFYNDSTAVAYVAFGAISSTSSYSLQMLPGAYLELPLISYSGKGLTVYTGIVSCVWPSSNGTMRITEFS